MIRPQDNVMAGPTRTASQQEPAPIPLGCVLVEIASLRQWQENTIAAALAANALLHGKTPADGQLLELKRLMTQQMVQMRDVLWYGEIRPHSNTQG